MRYNFDREWKFSLGDFGIIPEAVTHGATYEFTKAGGITGAAALGFDDELWDTVDLPHDWQHNQNFDPAASANHGYRKGLKGWYRKKFCLDESDRGRALNIVFDGIAGISDLYLNGSKVFHNESRYNSFSVDITDIANFGAKPNILAVEVDCSIWEGWWYEGSGIYRHVWLQKNPLVHPAYNGIYVHPELDQEFWNTYIETELENASGEEQQYQYSVTIYDAKGRILQGMQYSTEGIAKSFEKFRICCEMAIEDPLLWDVDHPYLYHCKVQVTNGENMDETDIPFGYRTIAVDPDKGFFLNGREVKLLGTCNHQDHAGIGAALPDEVQRYRLQLLKDMGCNAYRCAHNTPPPELLDLCDQMGILVMDENRAFSTAEDVMRRLRGMVKRDRNHPCVTIYSVFNEEPLQGTAKGRKLAKRMAAQIKALDPERPVLGAFNGGYMEAEGAATVFDITGINYFTDSYDVFHEKYPLQPIVASELVSAYSTRDTYIDNEKDQVFSNYDEKTAPWGETVRAANKAVLSRDFVMGMFIWTGFDYRGEPSPYEWPSVSSHFGMLDVCGFPKDTYYLYQSYWKKETILHILPHWNHKTGENVRVMTFSNCEEVEIFLNGRSMGRKKNEIYIQCTWELKFEPGTLCATGYISGKPVIMAERKTAGEAVSIRVDSNRDYVNYSTKDALILNISAIDTYGEFQPLEESYIEITATGAKFLGAGNGNPNSHEREDISRVRLFRGRCQIILQAAADQDFLRVKLFSEKLGKYNGKWEIRRDKDEKEILSAATVFVSGWRMSHKAVKEKPKLLLVMDKSDMNTLEPVEFEGKAQSQMDGKGGWYCLYRTTDISQADSGKTLFFSKVAGDIEVYLGEECLTKKSFGMPGEVTVTLPSITQENYVLSIIVKNTATDLKAGILEPVLLIP